MSTTTRLAGKTALVTGGSRRLGAAICRELARRGAAVVVHYRHAEAEAIELNRELKNGAFSVRGDFLLAQDRDEIFCEAVEWMGRVDILVNNAAQFVEDAHANPAALREVNVVAPLDLSARMAAQSGKTCVIHMLDARIAHPPAAPFLTYTATKLELADSVLKLAKKWAPSMRVNGVAPGPVLPPEGVSESAGTLPLNRRPTPEEVAQTVAFLAENESITGQIMFVDGGQHLENTLAEK